MKTFTGITYFVICIKQKIMAYQAFTLTQFQFTWYCFLIDSLILSCHTSSKCVTSLRSYFLLLVDRSNEDSRPSMQHDHHGQRRHSRQLRSNRLVDMSTQLSDTSIVHAGHKFDNVWTDRFNHSTKLQQQQSTSTDKVQRKN